MTPLMHAVKGNDLDGMVLQLLSAEGRPMASEEEVKEKRKRPRIENDKVSNTHT